MHYTLSPTLWRSLLTGANLRPWRHVSSVAHLSLDELEQAGVRGVLLDADNTLVFHGTDRLKPELMEVFAELQKRFTCVLFSNRSPKRHALLKAAFDLPVVEQHHKKPEASGYLRACELAGLPREAVVMIGDRVLTDILGGNRAGLRTVLVDPFDTDEPFILRCMRKLERTRLRWLS